MGYLPCVEIEDRVRDYMSARTFRSATDALVATIVAEQDLSLLSCSVDTPAFFLCLWRLCGLLDMTHWSCLGIDGSPLDAAVTDVG